ncbi:MULTISPECIES: FHA domain-containing protein [unclassified Leucobacter]|uniref:FHA domain-containing protein n=1 Tax=unclassified Leucobacter TaxID=2621730 RepID=UPI0030191DA1
MNDQTSTPAPKPAEIWQCSWCGDLNASTDPDPLCINCGVARFRKTAQPAIADGAPNVPVVQAPPADALLTRRPKKKRDKRRERTSPDRALDWLHRTVEPVPATPPAATPDAVPNGLADLLPSPAAFGLATPDIDDIEATRVAAPFASPAATPVAWLLEFEGGTAVALPSDDVVLGRQPVATEAGVTTLLIPDPLKELSRTHARLRRDTTRDAWTIEDLDSANGVATIDAAGDATFATPRQPVAATEYLLIGRLRARLVRTTQTTSARPVPPTQ